MESVTDNQEFMNLPYLPSAFEVDKRYLEGKQTNDLLNFIHKRYSKNKKFISVVTENTTKTFIRNSSNIYSKDVKYPEWNDEKWVKRRKRELLKLEKYHNLNKQALFWTYKINNKPKFKALHASEYVISMDVTEKVNYIIVRTGEFLKQVGDKQSETWYWFKMWANGKVYKVGAESWDMLPLNLSSWEEDPSNPNYKKLPFTLIGSDLAKPIKSVLPTMENIISGGEAFGDISAQRNFMKFLYGVTNLSAADWKKFNEKIGLFESPNLPITEGGNGQSDLRSLDLGGATAQKDWQEFITNSLKRLAYSEGVDINGLFGELRVESGVARRLAMENIISVRDSKLGEWEEFEEKDQEVLIDLKIVNKTSEVEYSNLDMGETQLDKENAEKARQENILNRYKAGTITKMQMIMEMEGLNEQEAKGRYRAITTERTGGTSDNIDGNIQDTKDSEV